MFPAEFSHVHCAIYKVQLAINLFENIYSIEVWGTPGLLDFVLRALRALRPCDPRHHYDYVRCMYDACKKWGQTNERTES